MPHLLPEERSKLHEALRGALPKRSEFRMFLNLSCDISLDAIDDGSNYAEAVSNVISWPSSARKKLSQESQKNGAISMAAIVSQQKVKDAISHSENNSSAAPPIGTS
jgi:hypothetical protein